jgi:hypothetical protein
MAEAVKKADEAKIMDITVQSQSFRGASYWYGERSRWNIVESLAVNIGTGKGLSRADGRLGIIEVKYTRADFEEGRNAEKDLGVERGAIFGFDEFGRFNGKVKTIGNAQQKDIAQKAKLIEVDLKRLIDSNKEVRKAISDIIEHRDQVFIKEEIKRIKAKDISQGNDA